MTQLLVIGGASLDTLVLNGQKITTAGGGGVYTCLAAIRNSADAALFAPRPEPLPVQFVDVVSRFNSWFGPVIPAERMPRFEIEHRGDKANYRKSFNDAEAELSVDQLPADLGRYDFIHVTPLGDSQRQQEFLRACRERGARRLSAGTYWCTLREQPEIVRQNMALADVFFMNEEEACLLFGALDKAKTAAGKLLFVTLGAKGALVVQGDEQTHIDALPADVIDPTGAGDSFCGAVLAGLMASLNPVIAAHKAAALAAEAIGAIGIDGLLVK